MNFDVKRIGKKAIVVEHPLASPQFYGVKDSFWEKSKQEQRQCAIDMYVDSIDITDSDIVAVGKIIEDAERG